MAVEDQSSAALEALWRDRTSASTLTSSSGFTLGPGDILSISVPMIPELTGRSVRVSEHDTITLPMLGVVNVNGMTEQDLRQELAGRLHRYMYNPQVEVYLKTPENRVVSVLGTVKAPGRYLVASHSDTIMTMLSRAGGATELAGSQVLLFAVPPATRSVASALPSGTTTLVGASVAQTPFQLEHGKSAALVDKVDGQSPSTESQIRASEPLGAPLVISTSGSGRYLEMPVRPGDVIFVPAAGSVAVQGWVDKPGSFPITPGMTVLGSVAAAGGALFSSSATLVRGEQGRAHQPVSLNLSKIKGGQEPDVPVRGGDVIIVERSAVGAVPYSLYLLISKVGLGLPMY
jgi:polysaccharide export outer membrane protein